jgi:hypothetical protein
MDIKQMSRSLAVAAALALGMSAYGQTRHDDKPHGPPKKAVQKSDVQQPRGGTRHDEGRTGQEVAIHGCSAGVPASSAFIRLRRRRARGARR